MASPVESRQERTARRQINSTVTSANFEKNPDLFCDEGALCEASDPDVNPDILKKIKLWQKRTKT